MYSKVENPNNEIALINERIGRWIEKYPDDLSQAIKDWVINKDATCGYYYMNYKAHKPEKNYPGRLITSACGGPTERLSKWIEFQLKPLMNGLSYRLEDTSDFIRRVIAFNQIRSAEHHKLPIIHCSWDIEAMYPNIENSLGLEACRELLDKRTFKFPSTESIIDAIDITLQENIASFGEVVTKQKQGTAMGPHHSCSYADAAADKAVDQMVMSDANSFRHCIAFWGRLRDDIYCAWTGSASELQQFDLWMNGLNSRLNFTLEQSTESVVFLDLRVSTDENNLIKTFIYSKPCDSHAYMLPSSCHPAHICKNIPKGVMKRVKRNCTNDIDCQAAFREYGQYLRNRDYSEGSIQEAISQAAETSRDTLLGI